MKLDQKLVNAAIHQALTRFPSGYAGAGAVYTEDGQILTSVCLIPITKSPTCAMKQVHIVRRIG